MPNIQKLELQSEKKKNNNKNPELGALEMKRDNWIVLSVCMCVKREEKLHFYFVLGRQTINDIKLNFATLKFIE